MRRLRRLSWPISCAAVTACAAAVVFAGEAPTIRAVIVLPFLLVCPGVAVVRLLRLRDAAATIALALAASVAIDGIVPGALLYAHAWSTRLAFALVCGITLAAATADAAMTIGPRTR
jgi:hypothetical protein